MTALRIGAEPLTPAAVVAAARGGMLDVELTPAARERIAQARRAAEAQAERRHVYGRTTGAAQSAARSAGRLRFTTEITTIRTTSSGT